MNNPHLIEVDVDTTDICGTNRNHAEETMSPTSEKSNTLVKHKEVFQSLCHERGNREEFTWCLPVSIKEENMRMWSQHTKEMPPLLDYPCRRAMEPVIIAGGKIDNCEKERIPRFNI